MVTRTRLDVTYVRCLSCLIFLRGPSSVIVACLAALKYSQRRYCILQGESLARGPKLLSMYTVEQRGCLVRKYW